MADLKCTVENCTYNKDKLCSKGDIMVDGKNATSSGETCCESFTRAKDGMGCGCKSSLEHPCRTISIDCEAEKCVHNSNYKCVAEHVDINGCGACDCHETSCATFSGKCH